MRIDATQIDRRSQLFGKGFVNSEGAFYSGHRVLAFTTGLFVFYYVIAGLLFAPGAWPSWELPPLAYLLILLNIFCYLTSACTFYLDHFRIPLIAMLTVFIMVGYSITNVDHYFATTHRVAAWVGLDEAIELRTEQIPVRADGTRTMVLVAATGGGIQAGAWTAQVLSGLADTYGPLFSDSLVLISGVSGGSVGTMHYIDRLPRIHEAFPMHQGPEKRASEDAVTAAMASSLEAVGWGLAYPDLARLLGLSWIVPGIVDRGWAMERAWQGHLTQRLDDHQLTFGDLEALVGKGEIPIPVFNATLVETGERLLLSPVDVHPNVRPGTQDFNHLYPGRDVKVVTAARLSATFPYVTPVARASESDLDSDEPAGEPLSTYHVADGGFYDNYGVTTIAEWLDSVILKTAKTFEIDRILLIEIRIAGESDLPISASGWSSAFLAPLQTLYTVRGSTQSARNEFELDLLDRDRTQSCNSDSKIQSVHFSFSGEPVLSWKLSKADKQAIEETWRTELRKSAEVLACFF